MSAWRFLGGLRDTMRWENVCGVYVPYRVHTIKLLNLQSLMGDPKDSLFSSANILQYYQ